MTSQERAFHDFAAFAARLNGDEKGQAQTFLFLLLEASDDDANTLPEGPTFEDRVRFPRECTKFADFLWPGRDLILYLGRRQGGLKLAELGQAVGGLGYMSVSLAIHRLGRRLGRDSALRTAFNHGRTNLEM
jgi:hypothetical protein